MVTGEAPTVEAQDADPLIGLNLGGYIVTKLLASGGVGLVYEALHQTIGRRAAVKVLRPEVASDEEWTKRFLVEARAIASLNHRNVVEILNYGNTPDGRQYLMMAFLEGESLEQYIHRTAPVGTSTALGIIEQVLNGLSEAHKKGVVHRDLKPSNIVLLREHDNELLVKILDFGLARQDPVSLVDATQVTRPKEGTSLLAGTPEYIAPEQALGQKVDAAADLYSLGVTLFEMLAGRLPFQATSVAALMTMHVADEPPRLSTLVAGLPEELVDFVGSLLAKAPTRRPESADVARQQVHRIQKRLQSDATAVRVPKRRQNDETQIVAVPSAARATPMPVSDAADVVAAPQPRRWWPIVTGLALVAMLGAASLVVWRTSDTPAAVVSAPVVPPPPVVAVSAPTPPPPRLPDIPATALPTEPELAPLPHLEKKTPRAVRRDECAPTDSWRETMKATLYELGKVAAVDDAKYQLYDQAEIKLSRDLKFAKTPEQCAAVEAQMRELRRALRR